MASETVSPIGTLPDGWTLTTLGQITKKIGSGSTPSGGEKVYLSKRRNYAFVRSQNVFDFQFDSNSVRYISDDDASKLKSVFLEKDDLLLNITGDGITFARACLVPDEILPAAVNQHVAIIRLQKDKCLSGYLLAYLTLPHVKKYIESFNAGGSRRAITKAHIESFEIPLPPLSIQFFIQDLVFHSIKKIELNRQMNATLEAMAQALFKSWFVDFDPVLDNALAAGNPIPDELQSKAAARLALGDARKSLPADIQALFPSSFVLTEEMGWIPEGWEVGTIKNLTSVKAGYAYKSADFTNSGVPVIKIKNINSNKSVDVIDVDYVPESIAQKTKDFWLNTGSLLMAMTGATVGKFGLLVCRDSEHYLLNQRVAKFNTTNLNELWFVYCNLSLQQNIDFITNAAHGSAQPNISADTISSMPCLLPNSKLINFFGQKSNSFFQKILENKKQIFSIESIRDTLLPKLLSGELRIPDAENLAAEVL